VSLLVFYTIRTVLDFLNQLTLPFGSINEVLLLVVIYAHYYEEDYTLGREPVRLRVRHMKEKGQIGNTLHPPAINPKLKRQKINYYL
jgi:hypothetical protein